MTDSRTITLKPSHKSLFWWYMLGIVLIPLFGVGIYLIYRFYRAHNSVEYVVTDRSIRAEDSRVSETVDLANIRRADVRQRKIDEWFGIGDVILKTESRTVTLLGVETPKRLSEMILQAAEAERKRIADLNKKPEPKVESIPGRTDRIDYLTGLWQQGLLSDEDFREEKKHFE
jgi:hypothetical protein